MDQNMLVTKQISFRKKVIASICYALSGLILMFMNKIVLTSYRFPHYSIMALTQASSISLTLFILKKLKIVSFPNLSINLIRQLFPIPVFYLINLLTGLGATKYISVPMFVALRRFTIPLTIVLQYYILKTKTSRRAMFAIFLLVLGSLIAVLQDFQFNLLGYFLCLINDIGDSCEAIFCKRQLNIKNQNDESQRQFKKKLKETELLNGTTTTTTTTTTNSVYNYHNHHRNSIDHLNNNNSSSLLNQSSLKYDKNQNLEQYSLTNAPNHHHHKKVDDDDTVAVGAVDHKQLNNNNLQYKSDIINNYDDVNIGKVAIIYYCALLNIVPLCFVVYLTGDLFDVVEFEYWNEPIFTLMFISCSFFSLIFLLTWITCTDFNSPLLSQIVSVMRSILSTYVGMYVGGDYIFNVTNFFGLNLSMFGAFLYTYFNFSEEHAKECDRKIKKEDGNKEEQEQLIV